MNVNEINKAAVRALQRVWAPIAEQHSRFAEADAQFDGGEFSGPASERYEERHLMEICERVGARFNLTGCELAEMVWLSEHVQHDHFMEVVMQAEEGSTTVR